MLRVVLATHNRHKAEEFQAILGASIPGLEIAGYDGPVPVEDGVTFAQNALIKARAAAEHTGMAALADDSGICVEVLGGAPGIFSSRWSGAEDDDEANLRLLLRQLEVVPDQFRRAYFSCTIALVTPDGAEYVVEGRWLGTLLREPRGENGFGYDPIFLPEGEELSAAELPPERKNGQSHRYRAFAAITPLLRELAEA